MSCDYHLTIFLKIRNVYTTDFSLFPVTLFTLFSETSVGSRFRYLLCTCLSCFFLFLCGFLAVTFTLGKLFKHKAGRKYENNKKNLCRAGALEGLVRLGHDLFIIRPLVDSPSQTRCWPDMKSKQLAEVTGS